MNAAEMDRALARIACEIVERNGGAGNVLLLGIKRRGIPLADRIAKHIQRIEGVAVRQATIDVAFYNDDLTKVAASPVVGSTSVDGGLENTTVVLVDDVLYSGRTVWAAVACLLSRHAIGRIQLAVLVDRGHHVLPVGADYAGCTVPTRADEVVKVMLDEYDDAEQVLIVEVEAEAAS